MAEEKTGVPPQVAITLEPMPGRGESPTPERVVEVSRTLLARLFPADFAASGQVKASVARIGTAGPNARFEMSALFLYRQTYTAVTHKVVFSLNEDGYAVISVDGNDKNR